MAYTRGSANYSTHGFIPTHFSATIPVQLDKICVALDCVNRDWESEFENGGDIARVREFGEITVDDYTVDNTVTYETTTESYQDIVIDQIKKFAFKIDKVDKKQADLDVFDGYSERAAISVHQTVDTHLITGMTAAAPVYNTIGSTTLGHNIQLTADNVYDVLVDLHTLLVESNASSVTSKMPWLIVPPRVKGIMKKSGKLTPATEMGDKLIRNGVFGEFAGFEVKETTNLTLNGASGTNGTYWNILAGFNYAYTFAMQLSEVEGPFSLQTTFGDGIRGLFLYGSKAIKEEAIAKLIATV
jgi:hypothetical protein